MLNKANAGSLGIILKTGQRDILHSLVR